MEQEGWLLPQMTSQKTEKEYLSMNNFQTSLAEYTKLFFFIKELTFIQRAIICIVSWPYCFLLTIVWAYTLG